MKWGESEEKDAKNDNKITQLSIWLTVATFVFLWLFIEFPFTLFGFVCFALAIIIGVVASCGFLISGLLKSLKGGDKSDGQN